MSITVDCHPNNCSPSLLVYKILMLFGQQNIQRNWAFFLTSGLESLLGHKIYCSLLVIVSMGIEKSFDKIQCT